MLKELSVFILEQLENFIKLITDEEYQKKSTIFQGASPCMHIRHILEFYQCLIAGSDKNEIDYDKRKRNTLLETDKNEAIAILKQIKKKVSELKNKPLQLIVNFESEGSAHSSVTSSVERELTYNIEHAIHHMAIIKMGIAMQIPEFEFPENFDVAPSTIRYWNKNLSEKQN